MTHWADIPVYYPDVQPRSRVPEHLRDGSGRLSAADEVAWLRDEARAQWLAEHDRTAMHSLASFTARIAEVGEDAARDEVVAAAFGA